MGTDALFAGTSNYNVAVGAFASDALTTGTFTTALGYGALTASTTGGYNTAVGGYSLLAVTTGYSNVAVGYSALATMTTGLRNTGIGTGSGSVITTGSKNTILGCYDGNQGGLDIRTSNNHIVLSDGDGNPRCYWDNGPTMRNTNNLGYGFNAVFTNTNSAAYGVGIEVGSSSLVFFYKTNVGGVGTITTNGSSTSYNTTSDYRLKENVTYDWDATTRLKQLKPARFNFINNSDVGTVDGFLAHEVQTVVPEAVTGTHNEVDDDGNAVMQGIDQAKLVPLLVKTIQELEARITALENA